jgi:hypothetical protein
MNMVAAGDSGFLFMNHALQMVNTLTGVPGA